MDRHWDLTRFASGCFGLMLVALIDTIRAQPHDDVMATSCIHAFSVAQDRAGEALVRFRNARECAGMGYGLHLTANWNAGARMSEMRSANAFGSACSLPIMTLLALLSIGAVARYCSMQETDVTTLGAK